MEYPSTYRAVPDIDNLSVEENKVLVLVSIQITEEVGELLDQLEAGEMSVCEVIVELDRVFRPNVFRKRLKLMPAWCT